MKSSAELPLPSSTSSTSKGNSSGIGTEHSTASTATPLATQSAFLCCRARRRICAQFRRSTMVRSSGDAPIGRCSRSGTGATLQPAPEQRGKHVEGLVAVGQQRQLAVPLGKQGRKPGNAQVLNPREVRRGGGVLLD